MSLRSKLPSAGALFMFEAAARHRNFTLAAREFNVTQPAISRMILRLENHLGVTLFVRRVGGLDLTEEGKLLFRTVHESFGRIEHAVDEIESRGHGSEIVTLSVTSAFANHWLMPRFDRLRREVPNVTLRLDLIHGEPVGGTGNADLGLRYNAAEQVDSDAHLLAAEMVIPVCSPGYLALFGPIDGPNRLRGHILASLVGTTRIPWSRFVEMMALGSMKDATELSFSDYALVLQGAIKSQGVALGWWHVVAGELQNGGLVPAGGGYLATKGGYHLVTRDAASARPAVRRLREWLIAEFATLRAQHLNMGLRAVDHP